MTSCEDCKAVGVVIVDHRNGQYVCTECGVVQKDPLISTAQEWRSFESDSADVLKSRVGSSRPSYIPEQFHFTTEPMSARRMSSYSAPEQRLYRKLISAFQHIERLCETLNVPGRVKTYAKSIFSTWRMKRKKVYRAKVLCSAVVFEVANRLGYVRTPQEIERATQVPRARIMKARKRIARAVAEVLPQGPAEFPVLVERFITRLLAVFQLHSWAGCVHSSLRMYLGGVAGLTEKAPETVAASVLYKVHRHFTNRNNAPKFTLKRLAQTAHISESAILACVQVLPFLTQEEEEAETRRVALRRRVEKEKKRARRGRKRPFADVDTNTPAATA